MTWRARIDSVKRMISRVYHKTNVMLITELYPSSSESMNQIFSSAKGGQRNICGFQCWMRCLIFYEFVRVMVLNLYPTLCLTSILFWSHIFYTLSNGNKLAAAESRRSSSRANRLLKTFFMFCSIAGSLFYLQVPETGKCTEPAKCSSYYHIWLVIQFNNII
jgi:hypothetical protein